MEPEKSGCKEKRALPAPAKGHWPLEPMTGSAPNLRRRQTHLNIFCAARGFPHTHS